MATVKKSKTKKIVWSVIAVILVIAIIVAAIVVGNSKKKTEVSLTTISTSNIIQTVNSTGEVTSGLKKDYTPGTIATVKEVFVKVGDNVSKGDKLATFDTSNLDTQVANLGSTYHDAQTAYNTAVKNQNDAKAQLNSINSQIDALQSHINNMAAENNKAKIESTTAQTSEDYSAQAQTYTVDYNTGMVTYADGSIGGIIDGANDYQDQIENLIKRLEDLTGNIEETNILIQKLLDEITKIGEDINGFDSEEFAKQIGDAVKDGMKEAIEEIDWDAIVKEIASSDDMQLATAQLQLSTLQAQKEVYSILAKGTTVDAQKQVLNSSKSAYDTVVKARDSLDAGWTADFDGIITGCEIAAGGQTTALQSGLTLENLDTRVVTISLGEYDVHKVKVGMEATVTTAYGKYTGEVATIAPTATGASSSSMLDSVGSMAGISGLSSLTSSGAGVECTVVVPEPDENIIVGFDADVEIVTGDFENVPVVPIESIILSKEGTYVYIYDEAEQTVTKTAIETGATSDTSYEITSGLSVGQQIVATPQSNYEEDTFKVRVVDKVNIK